VNRLQLPWRGLPSEGSAGPFTDAKIAYVRPHELEILHYRVGVEGEVGTVQSIHAAGSVARVTTRRGADEFIDVELSRARLDELALHPGDSVLLRVRRSRLFAEDYAI
jgi:sulfate/thiosulfate transport system ATP-binding protein